MTESAGEFIVEIKNLKATDLTSRNRFKEKLKIEGEFDNFKFKTSKVLIGGGDIAWKYNWKQNYQVHSISELEQRYLRLKCFRSKADLYGSLQLDLWTIATGPVDHNLPLLDADKKVVGRLHFSCEMRQIASVTVQFKEVKMKNLPYPANHSECNPYLKYGYSKNWLAIQDGKMKAHYSQVRYHTTNPVWADDLPEIRFSTSLKELLHESIVLHVTHKGKIHNTTIGRCNLLFRTLVDNGKGFKDDDLISFKGPLKIDRAEIEGTLIFKYLPKLAQMKPVNAVKRAIHNENGIYDAVPLLPNLPVPKQTVHVSDEKTVLGKVKAQDDIRHTPTSTRKNALADKNSLLRNAINSPSVSKAVNESDSDDDSDDDDDTNKTRGRSDSVIKGEREETKEEKEKRRRERRERREKRRERRERKNSLTTTTPPSYATMTVDDLIMFSPPVATRNRANTFSATSSYSGNPSVSMEGNVNTYAQHESFVPSMYALNHSMNNMSLGFNPDLNNSSDNVVPHHIKPSGSYNIVDKQEYATYSPQSFPSLVVSKSKSMGNVSNATTDSYNPFLPSSDPQYQQQQQLQQQTQQTQQQPQQQQYKEVTPLNPFGTPNLPQAPILFMNQQQQQQVQQQPQPQ